MQFPPYFQNVRNALIRNGHSVAEASMITWGAIRHWAAAKKTAGEYGKGVHPEVVAAARAALAGIAKDSARAHAQSSHEHRNQARMRLREFAGNPGGPGTGDPNHAPAGAGGGRFTTGSSTKPAATGKPAPAQPAAPTLTPAQKTTLLTMAASDTSKATALNQQAAKLNLQITALAALITQETYYLNTAATSKTATAAGSTTATKASTTTAAVGTTATTTAKGTTTATAAGTTTASTAATLQANLKQYQQLSTKRDQLVAQAKRFTAQAAIYTQQAKG